MSELQNTVPNNEDINIGIDSNLSIPITNFNEGVLPSSLITSHEGQKFSKYDEGIPYAEALQEMGLESWRHEQQPWYASLGSAVNQAVVGEIVGGTLEGAGYLLDIPQYINLIKGTEKEYSNWLSDIGKDIREWTQEATPIYTDPFKEGEFSPEDWTWWMSNLPSIASTLSLAIPTGAIVKGISLLAKTAGWDSKMNATAKWVTAGLSQAVMSRHAENLMEASGTMDELSKGLSNKTIGKKEATEIKKNYGIDLLPNSDGTYTIDETTANEIGAKAASTIYKSNWAMLAQDIPQYLLLRTPFGKSSQELSVGVAKALGKDVLKPMAKKGAAITKTMLSEGFEEAYQYVVSERAKEMALADAGLMDRRTLGEAISDYSGRGEMWTSAFFGAFGAGVQQSGIGSKLSTLSKRNRDVETIDEARIKDIEQSGEFFKAWLPARQKALESGNADLVGAIDEQLLLNKMSTAAQLGNIDATIELINGIGNLTKEEVASLGITEEQIPEIQKASKEMVKSFKDYAKLYDNNIKRHKPQFAAAITNSQYNINKASENSSKYNSEYNTASNEWNDGGMLSSNYKEAFRIEHYEIPAIDAVIDQLERRVKEDSVDSEKKKFLQSRIDLLNDRKQSLKEEGSRLKKERTKEELVSDNQYEGTNIPLSRGKRRVKAVSNYIAPNAESSVDNLTKKYTADEIIAVNAYDAKRFSSPKFQDNIEKQAKKQAKENVRENVREVINTAESTQNIEDAVNQSSGTPMESVVNDEVNFAASTAIAEQLNDDESAEIFEASISSAFATNNVEEEAPVYDESIEEDVAEQEMYDAYEEEDKFYVIESFTNLANDEGYNIDEKINAALEALGDLSAVAKYKYDLIDSIEKLNLRKYPRENLLRQLDAVTNRDGLGRVLTAIKESSEDDSYNVALQLSREIYSNMINNANIKNAAVPQESSTEVVKPIEGRVYEQQERAFFRVDNKGDLSLEGVNLAPSNKKLSNRIDVDGISKNKYPIGTTIYFEVEKDNEYAKDDFSQRGILMVSYADGDINNKSKNNRKIIGLVPVSTSSNPSIALREQISKDIDEQYNNPGNIVTSRFTSKVSGVSAYYTRTNKRTSPLQALTKEDKNKASNHGGFVLAFAKDTAGQKMWETPNTPTPLNSNTKYSGEIAFIVDNLFAGFKQPLFGFIRKMGEYAKIGDKQKGRANEIFKTVDNILNRLTEYQADKSKNKKTIAAVSSEISKFIILPKTTVVNGKAINVNLIQLSKDRELWKQVFSESKIALDRNKLNSTEKELHNLGFQSNEFEYYNEAINDFLGVTLDPENYYERGSILFENKVEKQKEVAPNKKGILTDDIIAKKADIERRRLDEISRQLRAGKNLFGLTDEQIYGLEKIDWTQSKEIAGQNIAGLQAQGVGIINEVIEKINAKYDAELAALEKPTQQTNEVDSEILRIFTGQDGTGIRIKGVNPYTGQLEEMTIGYEGDHFILGAKKAPSNPNKKELDSFIKSLIPTELYESLKNNNVDALDSYVSKMSPENQYNQKRDDLLDRIDASKFMLEALEKVKGKEREVDRINRVKERLEKLNKELKSLKKPTQQTKATSQEEYEAKKDDIERRREESLENLYQFGSSEPGVLRYAWAIFQGDTKDEWRDSETGRPIALAYNANKQEAIDKINTKYDTELAELDDKSTADTKVIEDEEIQEAEVSDAFGIKDDLNSLAETKITGITKDQTSESKEEIRNGEDKSIGGKPNVKNNPFAGFGLNNLRNELEQNKGNERTKEAQFDYTPWNEQEEIAWFKKNFPQVPIQVLDNLKEISKSGKELWGVFKNASVYIANNAGAGTTYHEAFHAVFNLFLNESEANDTLALYAKERRLKSPKTASEKIIVEEMMADAFAEYVMNQSLKPKTAKIQGFFKKLWAVIKNFFNGNITNSEEFFARINAGHYKNAKVAPGSFGSEVERTKIAEWTARRQKDVVSAINKHILLDILPQIRAVMPDFANLSNAEVIDALIKSEQFDNLYATVYSNLELIANSSEDDIAANIKEALLYFYREDGSYGDLINESIRAFNYLNGIKINTKEVINVIDDTNVDDDTLEHQETTRESWMTSAVENSAKHDVDEEVRNFIRYLRVPNKKNFLGLNATVDYNETFNKLLNDLAGSTHIDDMKANIQDILNVGLNPEYKELLDKINNDSTFASKFFVEFSKTHTEFIFVNLKSNGGASISAANKSGVVNEILTRWKNDIEYNSEIISHDEAGNYVVDIEKAKLARTYFNEQKNNTENQSKILAKLGIDILPNVIQYAINEDVYVKSFIKPVNYILDSLVDGKLPFETTVSDSETFYSEIKNLRMLATLQKVATPSLYESAFRNYEGKTVYSHLVPNFVSKLVSNLTNKNRAQSVIDEYSQDDLFKRNYILKALQRGINEGGNLSEIFSISILDGMNDKGRRVGHDTMTKADRLALGLNLFYNKNSNTAYYQGPVLSDAPNNLLVKFAKTTNYGDIINELLYLAIAEQNFLDYQREVAKSDSKNKIKNYEKINPEDIKFDIMPMFNGFSGRIEDNIEKARATIERYLNNKSNEYFNEAVKLGSIIMDESGKNIDWKESMIDQDASSIGKELVKQFIYNDYLVNSSFSLLTVGNPAFYKQVIKNGKTIESRIVDYTKRAKEIYSPKMIPNVNGSYGDILVGSEYTSVYLNDIEQIAPSYDAISEAIDAANISEERKIAIKAEYEKVNYTDAQAYITLPFYRRTMIGLGRWNDGLQSAYDRLENGLGTADDIAKVLQPLKPFMYTQVFDKDRGRMIPVQHKNSEFLLLPQLVLSKNEDGSYKNETLAKLYSKMNDMGIDVVNFDSAVKVGLSKTTNIDEMTEDNIHVMNMEDRGIQMETPEHFIEASNKFGSQIRKLIMADLDPDVDYVITKNGEQVLSKKANELHRMYEEILVADLVESYNNVSQKFFDENRNLDKRKISKLLIDEANARGKGEEFIKALEVNADGDFKLPLFHPLHAKTAESLLNSIFRNNITNQKIAGGKFIQATSYGLSRELKLVFDGGSLQHAEVLLPAWSKEFFKDFVDENGNVDFDKAQKELPVEVFEMVGYRIPTEDKYSMLPLKVVGFLPIESGGAIMLPAEITKISGSDFDVDAMYVMMKAFRKIGNRYVVRKYHTEATFDGYNDYVRGFANKDSIRYINALSDGESKRLSDELYNELRDSLSNEFKESYNNIINSLKDDQGLKGRIASLNEIRKSLLSGLSSDLKSEFSTLKTYLDEHGIKGINKVSEYISLTNEMKSRTYVTSKDISVLNDLGNLHSNELQTYGMKKEVVDVFISDFKEYTKEQFDELKQDQKDSILALKLQINEEIAKLDGLLNYDNYKDSMTFNERVATLNTKAARDNMKIDIILSVLRNPNTLPSILTPGGFDKLKNEAKTMVLEAIGEGNRDNDVFSYLSRMQMAVDNMAGKQMTGIAANHNAHHALRQHANLYLRNPVLFNNKEGVQLSGKTPLEQYEFKSGRLSEVEVSTSITKNFAEFLAAIVDNAKDPIASYINYNEATADVYALLTATGFDILTATAFLTQKPMLRYAELVKGGMSMNEAFDEVIKENMFTTKVRDAKASNLNTLDLHRNLKADNTDYNQEVFESFIVYAKQAKSLGKLISASRADTKGLGSTIAAGEIMLESIDEILTEEAFPIEGVEDFFEGNENFKFVNAFTEQGIRKPLSNVIEKLFPYSNYLFLDAKRSIQDSLISDFGLTEKQRIKINNDIINYFISDSNLFEAEDREYYLNQFPLDYYDKINNTPSLKENKLIRGLLYSFNENSPLQRTIEFNNTGSLTSEEIVDFQQSWESLFDVDYKLAMDLVKYAYFTSGLGFGARGFSHLMSTDMYLDKIVDKKGVRLSDVVRNINNEVSINLTEFKAQFFRNNWKNKQFVPSIKLTEMDAVNGGFIRVSHSQHKDISNYKKMGKEIFYEFSEYITVDFDGVLKLYKFARDSYEDGSDVGVYREITKLGDGIKVSEYSKGAGEDVLSKITNIASETKQTESVASDMNAENDDATEASLSQSFFNNTNNTAVDETIQNCKLKK